MLSKHLLNESLPTGRCAQALWRRERLLDAALAVFVDKGVDGAPVEDITADYLTVLTLVAVAWALAAAA
jgi:predicted transcriptional regulator